MNNSITIPEIELHQNDMRFFENKIISIEDIFKNKSKILLDKRKLELFLNGVKLKRDEEDGIYKIYSDDRFIGIGEVKSNILKRDLIL